MTIITAATQLTHVADRFYGIDRPLYQGVKEALFALERPPSRSRSQEIFDRSTELISGAAARQGVQVTRAWSALFKSGSKYRSGIVWPNTFSDKPDRPWTLAILADDWSMKMFSLVSPYVVSPHFLGILNATESGGLSLTHFLSASYMDLKGVTADPSEVEIARLCSSFGFEGFEGIEAINPRSLAHHKPKSPKDAVWARSALEGHHEYLACRAPLVEEDSEYFASKQVSGPPRERTEPRPPYVVSGEHGPGFRRISLSDGTGEGFGRRRGGY